jgi:hypothetical protein
MKEKKELALKLTLDKCEHDNYHLKKIEPILLDVYEPGSTSTNTSVGGGSKLYDEGWERTFGAAASPNGVVGALGAQEETLN